MDDGKTEYCIRTFEKLVLSNGKIAALFSDADGHKFCNTEKQEYESFIHSRIHNAAMPNDLKPLSTHHMEVSQQARAAIHLYKLENNIPLETPHVNKTPLLDQKEVQAYKKKNGLPAFYPNEVVKIKTANDEYYNPQI
jgi:hypothetical protein